MARPNPTASGETAVRARPVGLQFGANVRRVAGRLPLHLSVIGLAALWSIPTIALLVSSFRDPGLVVTSGWLHAITEPFSFTPDQSETVLDQNAKARSSVN